MGHLILNQSELLKVFPMETELQQIIKYYETQFEQDGEVICRVKMNNSLLSEEDEMQQAKTPLSQIKSFEVESENPNQLFSDVITYWRNHLPLLIEDADHIAKTINKNSFESYSSDLSQFIDQCHLLVNSLSSINSLAEHRQLQLPHRWSESELKLWSSFDELLDAFTEKRTKTMAEIIEYNLADAMQNWFEILGEIPNL